MGRSSDVRKEISHRFSRRLNFAYEKSRVNSDKIVCDFDNRAAMTGKLQRPKPDAPKPDRRDRARLLPNRPATAGSRAINGAHRIPKSRRRRSIEVIHFTVRSARNRQQRRRRRPGQITVGRRLNRRHPYLLGVHGDCSGGAAFTTIGSPRGSRTTGARKHARGMLGPC